MWGGLRQTIAHAAAKGAENTGGLIAKIGQVVAPQDGLEENDELYDDDGVYDEDEEEEEEEEDCDESERYPDEYVHETPNSKSFGSVAGKFMGGAAKALQNTANRLTASLEHPIDHEHTHFERMLEVEDSHSTKLSPILLDPDPVPSPITQPTLLCEEQPPDDSNNTDSISLTYPEATSAPSLASKLDGVSSIIPLDSVEHESEQDLEDVWRLETEEQILDDVWLPETEEQSPVHPINTIMDIQSDEVVNEQDFEKDESNHGAEPSTLLDQEVSLLIQTDRTWVPTEQPCNSTEAMTQETSDSTLGDDTMKHEKDALMMQLAEANQRILQLQLERSQNNQNQSLYDTLKQEEEMLRMELTEAHQQIERLHLEASQNSKPKYETLQQEKDMLVMQLTEANQLIQRLQSEASHKMQDTQLKLKQLTQTQEEEIHRILEESTLQYARLEAECKNTVAKLTANMVDMEKRQAQALERLENKLARTIRDREDKDEEIVQLKNVIADMRTTLKENVEGAAAAEEEADELELENDELHKTIESLHSELEQLKLERKRLEDSQRDLLGVRMELEMVKEERDRQREKIDAVQEIHSSNYAKMVGERDAAKAQSLDQEQQLAAVTADHHIAQADLSRVLSMNTNLQRALEAFQVERESEVALWEENYKSSEQALIDAHKTELKAIKDTSDQIVREIQLAAEKAVSNMMQELSSSERKVDEYRKECITTRRSLDEAIHQLQRNQEDVIDRSVIKNILLDWHIKSGKAKKDVMLVLSSLLHFTEEEKEKCGLGLNAGSLAEKLVVAVAPPLTPAKSIDQIEGDTVRDKFVNFILAELGDDNPKVSGEH